MSWPSFSRVAKLGRSDLLIHVSAAAASGCIVTQELSFLLSIWLCEICATLHLDLISGESRSDSCRRGWLHKQRRERGTVQISSSDGGLPDLPCQALCHRCLSYPSFVPGAAVHHIAPTITSQQQIVAKVDGLVGDSAPLGFFDPLGYTKKASPADLKKYAGHSLPASAMLRRFSPCFDCVVTSLLYRECELKHGRVAMLASMGMVVADFWHPLYGGGNSANPLVAITQVPKAGLLQILAFIGFMEVMGQLNMQRADYEPGNFLGSGQWETSESWDDYQTRELNNGRLAMFASIGMLAHAALTGKGPLELIF
eukprot:668276-Pleurochrysis_carterae.AAC.6